VAFRRLPEKLNFLACGGLVTLAVKRHAAAAAGKISSSCSHRTPLHTQPRARGRPGMLRQTTRALAGMGGRAAGASSPGSAFAPHAAAGASWMQNRSIGKVGVPENYGQIDGVGTKFLGTPANHREVRHLPRVTSPPSLSRATTRRSTPQTRASRAGIVTRDRQP
jgi:hypothetical protein